MVVATKKPTFEELWTDKPAFEELWSSEPKTIYAQPYPVEDLIEDTLLDIASVKDIDTHAKKTMALADRLKIPLHDAEQVLLAYDKFSALRDKWKQKGEIGFWEAAAQDIGTKIAFSPVGAMETLDVVLSMKRLAEDRYEEKPSLLRHLAGAVGLPVGLPLYEKRGFTAEVLKQRDVRRIEVFLEKMAEREERGYSLKGKIGAGISVLPAWMIEFACTGGLKKIGSKTAKEFLKKHTKRQLVARTGAWMAGVATRTTLGMPHRVSEAILKRRLSEDPENWATSIALGWSEVFIEAASEEAGATISKGLTAGLTKLPFGSKFINTLNRAWVSLSPDNTSIKFWQKIFTKAGYSNIIGEIGEERLATIMHSVIGTEDFGAGPEAGIIDRLMAGLQQDIENFPAEAVILATPAAGRFALGKIGAPKTPAQKLAKGLKVPKEVAEEAVAALMEGKTIAEVDKTIITPAKILGEVPEVAEEEVDILRPEQGPPVTPELLQAEPLILQFESEKNVKLAEEEREAALEFLKQRIEGTPRQNIPDKVLALIPPGWEDFAERQLEILRAEAKLPEGVKIGDTFEGAGQKWTVKGLGRTTGGDIGVAAETAKGQRVIYDPEVVKQTLAEPTKTIEKAFPTPVKVEKPAKAKVPVEQLGGLPIEPPGLTKAEAVHLGKREQTALRAGQRLGQKIGYKKGYQEAALIGRRKLNVLRMDVAIGKKSKEDLRGVIQQFVPKDQQHRFMTRLSRVKDAKGVQKITGEIEHFIEQYEHRAAVRHFKTFVSGIKSKYKSGEVAFGQLPDNLRNKVMSTIDAYDTVQLSEEKAEDLIAHKEHIQKVSGSIADAFSEWENLDEQGLDILQLPNYRIRELQRLEKTPVAGLTIDEIEFIQDELESLLATNERKGQIKARIRAERLHTHITGAANEIHPRGETKAGEIKQPGYARQFIGIEQAQLRTLTGFATKQESEHTVRLLVDQLYEANRKRAANYKDFILYTREQRVKRGITDRDFNNLDEAVTVTLGGKEITITQDSLLSLWMDTEAEGNLRRLLIARGHNLRSDKNKPIRIGKVTLQEIQEAIAKLPDNIKSIGELAFDVGFQKQAPALNETWMELYNYPIAKHERHWPFPREIERLVEGPRAEVSLSMEMQGRYLPRTGGNARHTVIPFTRQFMKGLQADAATAAMTGPMQQAKALLANKKWRSRMRDSGQQPVMNAITTMLRRSQGLVSDQSVADLIAAKFLGKAGKSLLSARPSGMLIQTASVSAGYETIEPKYFINLTVPTPSVIKELKELSPTLWLRWEAKQFDYALGAASAQSGFKTLITGKPPITDRLVKHYTWGDQIAIYYGWTAAQNKVAAETDFARGTDEFTNASLDLLHKWLESQPQWDILNRTLLTSHPSPWLRGSMMFMSARNAQYNVMLRAYDDYTKGRIDMAEFSTRIGGVVQANITVSLARRLFRLGVKGAVLGVLFGLSDEEDKELVKELAKEEAIKDIKKVPKESVLNMFGLIAFGQIAGTIGYEAGRQIEGKPFPKKLSEARTGNIIADFTMDFTQFGIVSAKLAKEVLTGEVYVDRKRMGEAKWKDTAVDLANVAAEIIAMITGTPYSGPRSDIVWPTKTVLRGMSEDEYEKMRKELNKLRRKALQELVKELVEKGELPIEK